MGTIESLLHFLLKIYSSNMSSISIILAIFLCNAKKKKSITTLESILTIFPCENSFNTLSILLGAKNKYISLSIKCREVCVLWWAFDTWDTGKASQHTCCTQRAHTWKPCLSCAPCRHYTKVSLPFPAISFEALNCQEVSCLPNCHLQVKSCILKIK